MDVNYLDKLEQLQRRDLLGNQRVRIQLGRGASSSASAQNECPRSEKEEEGRWGNREDKHSLCPRDATTPTTMHVLATSILRDSVRSKGRVGQ